MNNVSINNEDESLEFLLRKIYLQYLPSVEYLTDERKFSRKGKLEFFQMFLDLQQIDRSRISTNRAKTLEPFLEIFSKIASRIRYRAKFRGNYHARLVTSAITLVRNVSRLSLPKLGRRAFLLYYWDETPSNVIVRHTSTSPSQNRFSLFHFSWSLLAFWTTAGK